MQTVPMISNAIVKTALTFLFLQSSFHLQLELTEVHRKSSIDFGSLWILNETDLIHFNIEYSF